MPVPADRPNDQQALTVYSVFPLARRGARSQSRHPTTPPFGCVGPHLARRKPLMTNYQRAANVGSGLGASWAARRGAAAGLVGGAKVGRTAQACPEKSGGSHAVVYDGPIPPESAGTCRRAALGGFKNFGHQFEKPNKGSCTRGHACGACPVRLVVTSAREYLFVPARPRPRLLRFSVPSLS
jgi:hypothetical protein